MALHSHGPGGIENYLEMTVQHLLCLTPLCPPLFPQTPQIMARTVAFASRSLSVAEFTRCSARLLCFNYDIVYRPGVEHRTAYCLSLPFPELRKLHVYMTKGWPASSKGLPTDIMPYYQIRKEFSMHESLIVRGSHKIVVPVRLRSHMVHLAHESHQGIVRTKQTLRDLYWWPKMDALDDNKKINSQLGIV